MYSDDCCPLNHRSLNHGYYNDNDCYYPKATPGLLGSSPLTLPRKETSKIVARVRHLNLLFMEKDFIKFKPYTHLTPKTTISDYAWVKEYVSDPANIEKHRFYPLLHYSKLDRKFTRPKENGRRAKLREAKKKPREIFYSNHLDGHVLSYYANRLNELLNEQYTSDTDLMNSVIAYRSIPFNKKRNKCNIDFAHEVFSYIHDSAELELSALCLDVSSYFDTINHKILKKSWTKLLGRFDLPLDHYKIFKSVTKFSYLEIGDVMNITPEHKIEKLSHLKSKSIDSFFKNGKDFQNAVKDKGLIRVNRKPFGIPQGSPISAVLSNLYLLEFDKLMVKLAKLYDGMYRRYSDDIVFVCDPKWIDKVNSTVKSYLIDELHLTIQDKKTQRVDFLRESKNHFWTTNLIEQGHKYQGRPLTYLGFDFDGKNIRIKQKSISSYYRKTKRIIRRAAYFAYKSKRLIEAKRPTQSDPWIYRTKIYRLKTHLGARKKTIDDKVFWGNYLSYAYNASRIMKEPAIRRQLRNHWRIVEGEIERFNRLYGLEKSR